MRCLAPRAPAEGDGRGGMRLHAPAKINLDLHVGPPRADGYHPLDSLVAKVTLYDEIHLARRPDGGIRFACEGADCGPDERNLARRAAQRLCERARPGHGADIRLVKRIPPGAGLGGGSSDAAAVLSGLNALWDLGLPEAELSELAAGLGSDVPLFLAGAGVHMTGRGERTRAVELPDFHALLILPPLSCATAEVYRAYDEGPAPARPGRPACRPPSGPPSGWRDGLHNDLAEPACRMCPELGRIRAELARRLSAPVHVSGSGSGLFVLCDDEAELTRVAAELGGDSPGRVLAVRRNPW